MPKKKQAPLKEQIGELDRRLLELHEAQLAHEACTEGMMVAVLEEIKRRVTAGNVMGSV